jgi:hypothetical protein
MHKYYATITHKSGAETEKICKLAGNFNEAGRKPAPKMETGSRFSGCQL